MLKGKFDYPDLDVLDSPLISPSPFSSLGNIPGSAIAERIFNDPESWEDTDTDEADFPVDIDSNEQLAWLTGEIEKFRAGMDSGRFDEFPSTPTDKEKLTFSLVETPTSGTMSGNKRVSLVRGDQNTSWKGIGKKPNVRPISLAALFETSNEDFSAEIQQQLSKILESGGIPHHIRPIPHSSALTPPSTSGTSSTLDTPLHPPSASTMGRSDGESPINVYSASATLSFLEWYGIYPDSPKLDLNRMRPKSTRLQAPLIQVPSPRRAAFPSSLLNSTNATHNATIRRTSPAPPPGLEPPKNADKSTELVSVPDMPRSSSPLKDEDDHPAPTVSKKSTPEPEQTRPLPKTTPPPYARTSSPAPESLSKSNQPSRSGTPSRGISAAQDQPVRRLPSIPPEITTGVSSRPATPPQPLPPVPVQNQTQVPVKPSTQASSVQVPSKPPQPPTRSQSSSRAQSRTASPAPVARASCPASSASNTNRPASSIRSPPLSGPAGPRTRSRASHNMRSSSGPAASTTTENAIHRPPVLRL